MERINQEGQEEQKKIEICLGALKPILKGIENARGKTDKASVFLLTALVAYFSYHGEIVDPSKDLKKAWEGIITSARNGVVLSSEVGNTPACTFNYETLSEEMKEVVTPDILILVLGSFFDVMLEGGLVTTSSSPEQVGDLTFWALSKIIPGVVAGTFKDPVSALSILEKIFIKDGTEPSKLVFFADPPDMGAADFEEIGTEIHRIAHMSNNGSGLSQIVELISCQENTAEGRLILITHCLIHAAALFLEGVAPDRKEDYQKFITITANIIRNEALGENSLSTSAGSLQQAEAWAETITNRGVASSMLAVIGSHLPEATSFRQQKLAAALAAYLGSFASFAQLEEGSFTVMMGGILAWHEAHREELKQKYSQLLN